MVSRDNTPVGSIDESLEKIIDLFLDQCTHGAQTRTLPPEFAACGQFIGEGASGIVQRGLHGIAAALRVLGPSRREDCRQIVARLVRYCEVCFQVNSSSPLESNQRIDDIDNVIKLGELLYGLSFVSASQADATRLTRHIAEQLQAVLINDRGWGYFLNDPEPQLLPTAYATRGLAQNGFDVKRSQQFITETLGARGQPSNTSHADLTTAVACAYCLTFVSANGYDRGAVLDTFDAAWRSLDHLLGEDVEQNLEYWRVEAETTHYVRVPWQLYLLALAAEYRFWRFATFRGQRRLKAVIKGLSSASFRYPYSGRYLSSRTNAIAYDALSAIRGRVRWRAAVWLAYQVDRLRVLLGSGPVRYMGAACALIIIAYSTLQWSKDGKASDLAPTFIGGFIALLLAAARR